MIIMMDHVSAIKQKPDGSVTVLMTTWRWDFDKERGKNVWAAWLRYLNDTQRGMTCGR